MGSRAYPGEVDAGSPRRICANKALAIPVSVLTGFLGSGKTTLLSHLLRQPELSRAAVIINEFGEIGLDHELVEASEDSVIALTTGCLCCKVRSDLTETLHDLLRRRDAGALPQAFDHIVIETSGLADPAPILQTFATDRALGGEFAVEVVIAVIDAVNGLATVEWSAEARKQVILADRLIVTKTDLAEAGAVERLMARIAALNPRAVIATAVDGELDPSCLTEAQAAIAPGDARSGFVAEAAHSDGIISFALTEDAPIAWEPFARAMETLLALRGPDLLRIKGLLNVAGCRGPVLVQAVMHLAHPPVELEAWPDDERTSRIVFITRNVPEGAVRELFRAIRTLAPAE